jgi:hypothetical protein
MAELQFPMVYCGTHPGALHRERRGQRPDETHRRDICGRKTPLGLSLGEIRLQPVEVVLPIGSPGGDPLFGQG